MKRIISIFVMLLFVLSVSAEPVPTGVERLNFVMPSDFKVAYRNQNKLSSIMEMVKKEESLKNWTRMITVQTFKNPKKYDPEKFVLGMAHLAKKQCGKVQVIPVRTGKQNGYAFSHKIIVCDPNKAIGKAELINVKAIKGDDLFYVAQVASRDNMDDKEMRYWAIYMRDVVVGKK